VYLFAHILHQSLAFTEGLGRLGKPFDVTSHGRKIHCQTRQHLSHAVVQFPSKAPSLLILQSRHARREFAQILIDAIQLGRAFPNPVFQGPVLSAYPFNLAATCLRPRIRQGGRRVSDTGWASH
jgi:hypothetical protein